MPKLQLMKEKWTYATLKDWITHKSNYCSGIICSNEGNTKLLNSLYKNKNHPSPRLCPISPVLSFSVTPSYHSLLKISRCSTSISVHSTPPVSFLNFLLLATLFPSSSTPLLQKFQISSTSLNHLPVSWTLSPQLWLKLPWDERHHL